MRRKRREMEIERSEIEVERYEKTSAMEVEENRRKNIWRKSDEIEEVVSGNKDNGKRKRKN